MRKSHNENGKGAPMAESREDKLREKGYVPASEVADKAGVNIATVYRWTNDGKVEGMSVGGRRFILWTSVLKHLGKEAAAALELEPKLSA